MQEREILFRGKRVDTGEWVTGASILDCTIENEKSVYIISSNSVGKCSANKYGTINNLKAIMRKIIPETRGEYTGLTDKNGVKIFEGDIIKHYFGEDYGVVKFGEYSQPSDDEFTKHIGFYVDWVTGESKDVLRKDLGYWVDIDSYDIIAGNIHDNSEFLEVK